MVMYVICPKCGLEKKLRDKAIYFVCCGRRWKIRKCEFPHNDKLYCAPIDVEVVQPTVLGNKDDLEIEVEQ